MKHYILSVSIGPVGQFIAAGRRSRDLWYGSTWLSETTAYVAEWLRRQEVRPVEAVALLLPTPTRLDAILGAMRAPASSRRMMVSNKILAEVTLRDDVADPEAALEALADGCRQEAIDVLAREVTRLLGASRDWSHLLDLDAYQRQLEAILEGDFVEFSAGWTERVGLDPFGGSVARANALRDSTPKFFQHPSFSREGCERSHLDAGRDSVLRSWSRFDPAAGAFRVSAAKAGLIENEQLDLIGLLRRGRPYLDRTSVDRRLPELPFMPLSRVALDPWLEGVGPSPRLGDLRRELRALRANQEPDGRFHLWCTPSREAQRELFPYDGGFLQEGGLDALVREIGRLDDAAPKQGLGEVLRALKRVRPIVRGLHREHGVPIPYYALVECDGDKVGAALQKMLTRDDYDALVRSLDTFADGVDELVRKHHGTTIYVAGDELLAYLPVDKLVSFVEALARRFQEAMGHNDDRGARDTTLSVGAVIAHVHDDLRGVRREARRALQRAKDHGGGSLCVAELPRSGDPRRIVDDLMTLTSRLTSFAVDVAGDDVSLRSEQTLREFRACFGFGEGDLAGVKLARQALLSQMARSGKSSSTLLAAVGDLSTWREVDALADTLRVASRLADVARQRKAPDDETSAEVTT